MGGVADPNDAERDSPYNQYTPPGHIEGASPSQWELDYQQVSAASGNDATSQKLLAGGYADTQERRAQYEYVQQQQAQREAAQQAQQRAASSINEYGGYGNGEYSPNRSDMLTDPFNRPEIFKVTDTRQKALMDTGLTAGQAAEQLRFEAQQKGDYAGARKYETLRLQAWTTETGKSAAYHYAAKESGLAQAANPFEYAADLFTYAEKGYPTRGKDAFSPVNYTQLGLSGGKGGQSFIWGNQPYDLRGAMDRVAYAQRTGEMGDYGKLGAFSSGYGVLSLADQQGIGRLVNANPANQAKGFISKDTMGYFTDTVRNMDRGGYVPSLGNYSSPSAKKPFLSFTPTESTVYRPADATLSAMSMWGGKDSNPISRGMVSLFDFALPGTFITQKAGKSGVITTTTSAPSGFDRGQGVLSDKAYGWFGSRIGISGKELRAGLEFASTFQREQANRNPSIQNIGSNMVMANVKETLDKPSEAGIWLGIGILGGVGFRGAEAVYGVGRGAIAEKVISQGGNWRRFIQGTDFVVRNTPKALAGIYAVDVAGRSTAWGSDLKAGNVSAKASVILTHEALPMAAGSMLGYYSPELTTFAVRSARRAPSELSDAVWGVRQRMAGIIRMEPGTRPYDYNVRGIPVYEVPRSPSFYNDAGAFSWGGVKRSAGRQQNIPVVDLIPTIDVRPTMNIQTGKMSYARPSNIATLAEQAMVIKQYRLTPSEIGMAKRYGFSLNDILAFRGEITTKPAEMLKTKRAYELANQIEELSIYSTEQPRNTKSLFGTRELVGNNLIRNLYPAQEEYGMLVQEYQQKQKGLSLFGSRELVGNNLIRKLYPQQEQRGIRTIDLTGGTFALATLGGIRSITRGDTKTRQLTIPDQMSRELTLPRSETRLTNIVDLDRTTLTRQFSETRPVYDYGLRTRGKYDGFTGKGGGIPIIPIIPFWGGGGGSGYGSKGKRGRRFRELFTTSFGDITKPLFSPTFGSPQRKTTRRKKRKKR